MAISHQVEERAMGGRNDPKLALSKDRDSRKMVYKSFEYLHKERAITIDLSGTTKILKRIPPHIARRLNYIGVKMR